MIIWQNPANAPVPKDREILVTVSVKSKTGANGRVIIKNKAIVTAVEWAQFSETFRNCQWVLTKPEILAWAEMPEPYMGE